ncbi:MAG: carbonate dehydratase [Pseudomonadales bacterium]
MSVTDKLFEKNRRWAMAHKEEDPAFFMRLARQQSPKFLWIGCSDSRVPANEIVGMMPGELFVHRNVANLVKHSDLNCLSVIQYAVEVLKVEDIIVCGHYGCGGVAAAMTQKQLGLIDHWLHSLKTLYQANRTEVDEFESKEASVNRLCELSVIEQVAQVCQTSIVQNAWHRGQSLTVHGYLYDIKDGMLRDAGTSISGLEQIPEEYRLNGMP